MMTSLITPARVVPRLQARDIRHVIDEMTCRAAVGASLDPEDPERIRQAVLDRGASSVFGFGRGVAIPHAAIPDLEQPMGVFARLSPAQDFGAADEVPADLVFLLLSPDGDDPTHLRALACVARRLRDHEVAARLRSAQGAEAIHIVLTSDAWRVFDEEPAAREVEASVAALGRDLTNGAMCTRVNALC